MAVHQGCEIQIIFLKKLCQHLAVELVQIENSDFRPEILHVIDHLRRLGLIDGKLVLVHAEFPHRIHIGLNRECIVLGRYGEPGSDLVLGHIAGLEELVLLYHLAGIADELLALRRDLNSPIGSAKEINPDLLLQLFDGSRQGRL